MQNKARIRKLSIVLFLAIIMSLFGRSAYAQETNPIVEVFRLGNFYVGIKITFPTGISGDFGGVIRGKYFNCVVIPSSTLYCIAPFRVGSDPSLLTIYEHETGKIILQDVIYSPGSYIGGDEPTPTPPPEEECIECIPQ